MSIKTLTLILLLGMALSACSGFIAEPTQIPTATATATTPVILETPTATEMPFTPETPTASATPTEFVPNNPADCTNSAAFVEDVTIPDYSTFVAGSTFTKTWRIQNTGTCVWWSGYTLGHYSEERMGAPDNVPLSPTRTGETVDISINLIAPQTTGQHQGNFVIKNPAGLIMKINEDSRLWVVIKVVAQNTTVTSPAPTDTPTLTPTNTAIGNIPGESGYAAVTCAYTEDATRTGPVVEALNAYRAQNGLPALTVNAQLSEAAQAHAADMACNQLFSHDGSNGSTSKTRVAASGYAASSVAENVYGSYPPLSPEQAVMWWKTDLTDLNHNKNMLSTKYKEIGVGYAFYNNFGYYVITFATP